MPERRTRPRAQFQGWVELILPEGRRRLGSGVDLSVGGIGVTLEPPLPTSSDRVTSEFVLPGISLPLAVEGEVAWRDPKGRRVGVRFEALDGGLAELIDNYVAGRL